MAATAFAASAQHEWTRGGRHAIKGGYEWFLSRRVGGNEPSSTDYTFNADYALDPRNELPARDARGHLVPLFVPGLTKVEHWLPERSSILTVDTQSVYVQDHWAIDIGRLILVDVTRVSAAKRSARSPA
jgi:hypothetical protein